jgi:hypothetical protein
MGFGSAAVTGAIGRSLTLVGTRAHAMATRPDQMQGRSLATGGRFADRVRRLRQAMTGLIGAVTGLLPHVLHHVGLLAGTALVAGSGGTALFGVVGLLASVPMLLRLRRRFGSWRAPAIGLAVFALTFTLSAFVIGPAVSGRGAPARTPVVDHGGHHN